MTLLGFSKWLGLFSLLGAFAIGCKDEPPKVGPDAAASGSAGRTRPRTEVPKMSPQATKEFRIDSCYFGTLSLRITRDAYLASLGTAEPSDKKLPSFGEFPEIDTTGRKPAEPSADATATPSASAKATAKPKATGAPKAKGTAAGTAGPAKPPGVTEPTKPMFQPNRLPYQRYVHSCTLAKNVPGAEDPKIDDPLKTYEEYVSGLNKLLQQASQYYQRKEYEKDQFVKGKDLHKQLTESFAKLDERIDAFGAAVVEWRKGLAKIPDKLDASGDIALGALGDARQLTISMIGKGADAAALKPTIDKLGEDANKLDQEGQSNAQAAFPRMVTPTLRAFVQTATEAHGALEKKEIGPVLTYKVTATFTALSEACNRGITRHLYTAARGAGPGGPGAGPPRPMPGPRPQPRPDEPQPPPPPAQ